jgi:hypothetical protein
VRADRQVLICPACQASIDWTHELDRCQECGSVHLVRRLGEVECRECGTVCQPAESESRNVAADTGLPGAGVTDARLASAGLGSAGLADAGLADAGVTSADLAGAEVTDAAVAGLADEVERALAKVLGSSRQRPPYAMS